MPVSSLPLHLNECTVKSIKEPRLSAFSKFTRDMAERFADERLKLFPDREEPLDRKAAEERSGKLDAIEEAVQDWLKMEGGAASSEEAHYLVFPVGLTALDLVWEGSEMEFLLLLSPKPWQEDSSRNWEQKFTQGFIRLHYHFLDLSGVGTSSLPCLPEALQKLTELLRISRYLDLNADPHTRSSFISFIRIVLMWARNRQLCASAGQPSSPSSLPTAPPVEFWVLLAFKVFSEEPRCGIGRWMQMFFDPEREVSLHSLRAMLSYGGAGLSEPVRSLLLAQDWSPAVQPSLRAVLRREMERAAGLVKRAGADGGKTWATIWERMDVEREFECFLEVSVGFMLPQSPSVTDWEQWEMWKLFLMQHVSVVEEELTRAELFKASPSLQLRLLPTPFESACRSAEGELTLSLLWGICVSEEAVEAAEGDTLEIDVCETVKSLNERLKAPKEVWLETMGHHEEDVRRVSNRLSLYLDLLEKEHYPWECIGKKLTPGMFIQEKEMDSSPSSLGAFLEHPRERGETKEKDEGAVGLHSIHVELEEVGTRRDQEGPEEENLREVQEAEGGREEGKDSGFEKEAEARGLPSELEVDNECAQDGEQAISENSQKDLSFWEGEGIQVEVELEQVEAEEAREGAAAWESKGSRHKDEDVVGAEHQLAAAIEQGYQAGKFVGEGPPEHAELVCGKMCLENLEGRNGNEWSEDDCEAEVGAEEAAENAEPLAETPDEKDLARKLRELMEDEARIQSRKEELALQAVHVRRGSGQIKLELGSPPIDGYAGPLLPKAQRSKNRSPLLQTWCDGIEGLGSGSSSGEEAVGAPTGAPSFRSVSGFTEVQCSGNEENPPKKRKKRKEPPGKMKGKALVKSNILNVCPPSPLVPPANSDESVKEGKQAALGPHYPPKGLGTRMAPLAKKPALRSLAKAKKSFLVGSLDGRGVKKPRVGDTVSSSSPCAGYEVNAQSSASSTAQEGGKIIDTEIVKKRVPKFYGMNNSKTSEEAREKMKEIISESKVFPGLSRGEKRKDRPMPPFSYADEPKGVGLDANAVTRSRRSAVPPLRKPVEPQRVTDKPAQGSRGSCTVPPGFPRSLQTRRQQNLEKTRVKVENDREMLKEKLSGFFLEEALSPRSGEKARGKERWKGQEATFFSKAGSRNTKDLLQSGSEAGRSRKM